MALAAPNVFDPDDFKRMRTPSRPYDATADYSRLIAELVGTCRHFGYLGISPQNLVAPGELSPVIAIPYYDKPIRVYVAPRIEEYSGGRIQLEGCANIRLVRDGKKFSPAVLMYRPTRVVLSHMVEGQRVTTTYRDRRPLSSRNPCAAGIICHEVIHTEGGLIADFARRRLLTMRRKRDEEVAAAPELKQGLRAYADLESPFSLVREGDCYALRLLSEWDGEEPPPVSPDALYFDYFFRRVADVERTFVPRDGTQLPIRPSGAFRFLYGNI